MHTSRAYWDLKAEQVMDRVFRPTQACDATADGPGRAAVAMPDPRPSRTEDDDSIEVEVREEPDHRPGPAAAGVTARQTRRSGLRWMVPLWQRQTARLQGSRSHLTWPVTGLACLALGVSTTLWLGWRQANQSLQQERTIRLLEGIRQLQSDEPSRGARSAVTPSSQGEPADALPPPPPAGEAWIEDLQQLEGDGAASAPLRVPVSGTLRTPAPAANSAIRPLTTPPPLPPLDPETSTPELVGVMQIPGRPGAAIFQMGSSSTNASAGESIGSSGWRLVSTGGDSAVIERAGVRRRVSISGGL